MEGDIFKFSVLAELVEILIRKLEGQLGDFTITELSSQPAKLDSQSWIYYQLDFKIEPDLPGETSFPPLKIILHGEDREMREVHTKAVPIQVLSVGVDGNTQLRDIAPDEREPTPKHNSNSILIFVLLALIIAAIGGFIFTELKANF